MANHEEEKDSKGHPIWNEKNENLDVFETTNEILTQQYPYVDWKKAMKVKGEKFHTLGSVEQECLIVFFL